jgi:glycerol-3-phosphate cytidylyltransferase
MRRVITYGTFDLFHYGHVHLLRRAREQGDYLIVALSTDDFNEREKGKRTYFSYAQRKLILEAIRYVDEVIPEESWEQKRTDVKEHGVSCFVIGDDWRGKFDFLKEEGCEVVYLERTPEVSSSGIKTDYAAGNRKI